MSAAGDHAAWIADRRVLIVLISAVILTPLCMPRELNALEWVNYLLFPFLLLHLIPRSPVLQRLVHAIAQSLDGKANL